MPTAPAMKDIYRRLKPLGFDAAFVRELLLPDWWDDELANVPANRAIAEAAISRHLKISVDRLATADAGLTIPSTVPVRLKSATRGTNAEVVRPSIAIAQRTATLLVQSLSSELTNFECSPAQNVRQEILAKRGSVTLDSLLEYCWSHGILIAHLDRLPRVTGFRKFDGLALFAHDRPVVLLAEKKDAPAWLAFHIAHELGHLMCRHVTPGSALLPDENLERIINDTDENEADAFANELLTGDPCPNMKTIYGMTAEKLVKEILRVAPGKQIDPSVYALVYGHNADRMPVAVKALSLIKQDIGARGQIRRYLSQYISTDKLSDTDAHFLETLVMPHHSAEPTVVG
jgi:hypothetical protein